MCFVFYTAAFRDRLRDQVHMHTVRFEQNRDLGRLEDFLRRKFLQDGRALSWLPQRLHDIVYRVGAQEEEDGTQRSSDHMYLWEDDGGIAACILADGENIYACTGSGREELYPSMIRFAERECLSLFTPSEDGSVKFWAAAGDRLPFMGETLAGMGYSRYPAEEYLNVIFPSQADTYLRVPEGFRFLYGEEYPGEANKWSALRLGFHPEWDSPGYRASMGPYDARKSSSMYPDSFECLITDSGSRERNDVCAYCFVYVDRKSGTALIEPLSTRERYRGRGLGTALVRGAVLRCAKLGIDRCYVDSFGEDRRRFYENTGFVTEDTTAFWYRTMG